MVDKTFGQLVREYFPRASSDEVDYILWSKTGYPSFWETNDVEACLRKQLEEFKNNLRRRKMNRQDGKSS